MSSQNELGTDEIDDQVKSVFAGIRVAAILAVIALLGVPLTGVVVNLRAGNTDVAAVAAATFGVVALIIVALIAYPVGGSDDE